MALTLALSVPRVAGQNAAISPEEAAPILAPYILHNGDLPSGNTVGDFIADAPSVIGYANVGGRGDLTTSVADVASRIIVRITQFPTLATPPTGPTSQYSAQLMTSVATAQDYASGKLNPQASGPGAAVEPVDLGATFGDASVAWRVIATPQTGPGTGGFRIRWVHGQVVLIVYTFAAPGKEKLDDALALVAAIDQRLATLPVAQVGPGTVPAPFTELQRARAMQQLVTIDISASDAPAGYRRNGPFWEHPADSVIRQSDPMAALQREDVELPSVMGMDLRFFTPKGNSGPGLILFASLIPNADIARAALTNLTGSDAVVAGPTAIDPPIAFGDAQFAWQDSYRSASGTINDDIQLSWLHGPLFLAARVQAAQGTASMDDLTAFARQVEDAYNRSGFAGR